MSDEIADHADSDAQRHEIDCVCGETSVGKSPLHAEIIHLNHFLDEHNTDAQEEQLAREQLERAQDEWGGFDA